MRAFKALRRSIKGEKDGKPHVAIAPKSAVAIVPPKKVRYYSPPGPAHATRRFVLQ
jgi:bud emergence protein 1